MKMTPLDSRILTRLYGRAGTEARQALRAAHDADSTVRVPRPLRVTRTRRTATVATYVLTRRGADLTVILHDGTRGRVASAQGDVEAFADLLDSRQLTTKGILACASAARAAQVTAPIIPRIDRAVRNHAPGIALELALASGSARIRDYALALVQARRAA